jgi:hypothetical protein
MKFFVLVVFFVSLHSADAVISATHLRESSNRTYTMAQHLKKSPMLMQVEYELSLEAKDVVIDKIVLGAIVGIGGSTWGFDRCLMQQFLLGTLKGITCGGCCIWGCIDFFLLAFNLLTMAPNIDMFGLKATFKPGTITNGCYVFLAVYIINMFIHVWSRPKEPKAEFSSGLRRNVSMSFAGQPTKAEIQAIFKKFDKDGNGLLDRQEMEDGLKYLGIPQELWASIIKNHDKNEDGQIDINEFAAAFQNGAQWGPRQ